MKKPVLRPTKKRQVEDEPFSYGDGPAKVDIRIQAGQREPLPSKDFDKSYIPLSVSERRARRELIRLSDDVYVAEALRAQEVREEPYIEALRAMFGKNANDNEWRYALCLEARSGSEAQKDLSEILLQAARTQNADELKQFAFCAGQLKAAPVKN